MEGGDEVKELLSALVQLDRVQGLRLLQLEGAGERHRGLCSIIQSGVGWNHSEPQTRDVFALLAAQQSAVCLTLLSKSRGKWQKWQKWAKCSQIHM